MRVELTDVLGVGFADYVEAGTAEGC